MRGAFKLIFPSKRFVLMLTEGMVWENLHSAEHLIFLEVLSQRPYVFFEIADSRHKDISEPERLSVLFQPFCGLYGLRIAASGEAFVSRVIELLAVQKNQVGLAQQLFYVAVPGSSVSIYADIDAFLLQSCV